MCIHRILALLLIVTGALETAGQTLTQFDFTYNGPIPPPCNTFATATNFYHPWKSSHGSPQVSGNSPASTFNNVARLVGNWKSGESKAKGEGIYIAYDFKVNHTYDISFRVGHYDGYPVGLTVAIANSLTEKSNASCDVEERPTVSETATVYETNEVYDGSPGDTNIITRTIAPTDKEYKYLWFSSKQIYIARSGSFTIDKIEIFDRGSTSNPDPGPGPDCGIKGTTHWAAERLSPLPDDGQKAFGSAVAAHNEYFVVGAYLANKAFVYKKSGCSIELMDTFNGPANGRFGYSVDIYNDQLIIGDLGPVGQPGSAVIYKLINGVWTYQNKLFSVAPAFGAKVSICDRSALIGSPLEDGGKGAVYFYERDFAGLWWSDLRSANTINQSGFGRSVSIRGNSAIVGAPENANAVYLFNRTGTGSTLWEYTIGFNSATATWPGDDNFGQTVIMSDDGLEAYASSGEDNSEELIAVLKYVNGSWSLGSTIGHPESFASDEYTIAVRGDILVVTPHNGFNMPYIRQRNSSGGWPVVNPEFGNRTNADYTVAIGNDYIIFGSPELYCGYSGSVYVFDLFAAINETNHQICNKNYTGAQSTVLGRSITIGSTTTCTGDVTYASGASAEYYANQIILKPGFKALAGSNVSFRQTGCAYGTGFQTSAGRIASPAVTAPVTPAAPAPPMQELTLGAPVSVYPNPVTTNHISVHVNDDMPISIQAYTLSGLQLNTTTSPGTGNSLDVNLPGDYHGVIILKVHTKTGIHVTKVVRE
jgi:hypothetical protein